MSKIIQSKHAGFSNWSSQNLQEDPSCSPLAETVNLDPWDRGQRPDPSRCPALSRAMLYVSTMFSRPLLTVEYHLTLPVRLRTPAGIGSPPKSGAHVFGDLAFAAFPQLECCRQSVCTERGSSAAVLLAFPAGGRDALWHQGRGAQAHSERAAVQARPAEGGPALGPEARTQSPCSAPRSSGDARLASPSPAAPEGRAPLRALPGSADRSGPTARRNGWRLSPALRLGVGLRETGAAGKAPDMGGAPQRAPGGPGPRVCFPCMCYSFRPRAPALIRAQLSHKEHLALDHSRFVNTLTGDQGS